MSVPSDQRWVIRRRFEDNRERISKTVVRVLVSSRLFDGLSSHSCTATFALSLSSVERGIYFRVIFTKRDRGDREDETRGLERRVSGETER